GRGQRTIGPVEGMRLFLALSGDGKRVAAMPNGGRLTDEPKLRVWDTATGRELFCASIDRSRGGYGLTFSPDGRRILTLWFDVPPGPAQGPVVWQPNITRIWDLESAKELPVLPAQALEFSPDGARVVGVTGSDIKVWDAATGRELLTLEV